jgi:hypothetical protein
MTIHRQSFVYGASLALLGLIGCASTLNYRYYGLSLTDICYGQGSLLGKLGSDGWPDLPFTECQPDAAVKGKCVVELAADHFAKDAALQQCQSDLKSCESGVIP